MPKDGKYGRVTLERRPDAPDDEPAFVLRAQDVLAPAAVQYYADLVEACVGGMAGRNMAHAIRDRADEMAAWAKRKLPDGT